MLEVWKAMQSGKMSQHCVIFHNKRKEKEVEAVSELGENWNSIVWRRARMGSSHPLGSPHHLVKPECEPVCFINQRPEQRLAPF